MDDWLMVLVVNVASPQPSWRELTSAFFFSVPGCVAAVTTYSKSLWCVPAWPFPDGSWKVTLSQNMQVGWAAHCRLLHSVLRSDIVDSSVAFSVSNQKAKHFYPKVLFSYLFLPLEPSPLEKLSIFSALCAVNRFDGRPSHVSSSHVVFGLAVTPAWWTAEGLFLERNWLQSQWRLALTAPLTRLGAATRRETGGRIWSFTHRQCDVEPRRCRVSSREEPNPVWLSRLFILLTSQLCLPKIESLSTWLAICITELQPVTCCFFFF